MNEKHPITPMLCLALSGEELRPATAAEVEASRLALEKHGDPMFRTPEGWRVYVLDPSAPTTPTTESVIRCDLCDDVVADDREHTLRTRGGAILTACWRCSAEFLARCWAKRIDLNGEGK